MEPEITPELMAEQLSLMIGRKMSEAEMLPLAHAYLALPDNDPRLEKLWLTLFNAFQASEDRDFRRVARLEMEYLEGLFNLMQ